MLCLLSLMCHHSQHFCCYCFNLTVAYLQINMSSLPHYHNAEHSLRAPPLSKLLHQFKTTWKTLYYCSGKPPELCCPLLACTNTSTTAGSTHHVILAIGELKTLQCMTTPFPSTAIYCRLFSVKIRGWMSGERVISIAPLNTTKHDWISLFISCLVMHVVIS